jgi:hypothetical protein
MLFQFIIGQYGKSRKGANSKPEDTTELYQLT